jgi:ABC-type transport system involved in multi-copper enzyme maturation permease subunit
MILILTLIVSVVIAHYLFFKQDNDDIDFLG